MVIRAGQTADGPHPRNVTAAVASTMAANSYAGCQIGANDSVYNTPITSLPVNSNSAAWVAQTLSIGAVPLFVLNSFGINIVNNSTPVTASPTFYYTPILNGQPFVFAPNPRHRESGELTTDGQADHHLISINRQTCQVYESYQDGGGANGTNAQSGYTYLSTSYSQPTGGTTDAAGLPLLPLTMHLSELNSGVINHALRFTSCVGCISNQYLWPATSSTGGQSGAAPMGSRWRLKSTFNISGFSPKAQVVLKALQTYGMILADMGGINQIETSSDVNLDATAAAAMIQISDANITAARFDVVDESSLMQSSNTQRVKNSLSEPLQSVLVGTPYTSLIFQSGRSLPLTSWVNGSSNQAVTWSASTGAVSGSTYTPPAVSTATPLKLTVTSATSSTASAIIYGWIIPAGPIRIDVGNPSNYTDSEGNAWMADTLGFESGSFSQQNDNYPANAWGDIVNAPLYETYNYTWGDDITYGPFVLPNGTYSVTYYFGRGECSGTFDPTGGGSSLAPGPVVLDVNGTLTPFNVASAEWDTCRIPASTAVTATVKNNLLTVALRSANNGLIQSAPQWNGLSIIPQ